jgi:hypothetical protein
VTLASMTRLTRAFASLAAAKVRERVRRATASPRPGAVGMFWDLVRDETGQGWGEGEGLGSGVEIGLHAPLET